MEWTWKLSNAALCVCVCLYNILSRKSPEFGYISSHCTYSSHSVNDTFFVSSCERHQMRSLKRLSEQECTDGRAGVRPPEMRRQRQNAIRECMTVTFTVSATTTVPKVMGANMCTYGNLINNRKIENSHHQNPNRKFKRRTMSSTSFSTNLLLSIAPVVFALLRTGTLSHFVMSFIIVNWRN